MVALCVGKEIRGLQRTGSGGPDPPQVRQFERLNSKPHCFLYREIERKDIVRVNACHYFKADLHRQGASSCSIPIVHRSGIRTPPVISALQWCSERWLGAAPWSGAKVVSIPALGNARMGTVRPVSPHRCFGYLGGALARRPGAVDRSVRCPVGLCSRLITTMSSSASTRSRHLPMPSPSAPSRFAPDSRSDAVNVTDSPAGIVRVTPVPGDSPASSTPEIATCGPAQPPD